MCTEKICEILLKSLSKCDKKKIEELIGNEISVLRSKIIKEKLLLEEYYNYCISREVPLGSPDYVYEGGINFKVPPRPNASTIMYTYYVSTEKIQNRINGLFESIEIKTQQIKQLEELAGW